MSDEDYYTIESLVRGKNIQNDGLNLVHPKMMKKGEYNNNNKNNNKNINNTIPITITRSKEFKEYDDRKEEK